MNQKVERLLKDQGGNYIFPFFWQHGETEEVLREYMKVIDESHIKAVCVESRPHPDFCGEKWWQDMDVILDEAKKRGMQVWILDDSHFPTGFANGAIKGQPDELCRQSLCCRIYDLEGKDEIHIGPEEILHPDEFQKSMIENYTMEQNPRTFDNDRLFALYAVNQEGKGTGFWNQERYIDLIPFLKEDMLDWNIPAGKWKIYALHLSSNQGYHRSYINMMDRKSCRILLDAVYEPHYAHYKEEFGKTIAGFFSDEPELGNGHMYDMEDEFGRPGNDYPWSSELKERLKESLGEEYRLSMILLWENEAEDELKAKARYAYMDAVTSLVREDFSEQVGAWCRERGVKYIGHLIEDDNHHTRTGCSLGHYFRGLAGQDMSGIDDIGGQVFPQGEDVSYNHGTFQHRNGEFYHYMLGKLGSSAAAIEPLKQGNSMCEIFGNYGWAEGVRLEKYLADHFLVRGINHYVPHAFSPKEFPDKDCPPHFYAHGHNPQYRHFGYLMAYLNRVCELISGGRHAAPVAVLYHAEGDWTGKHMTSDRVGHILSDAQIEYDYIPQDVFAKTEEYRTEIAEGLLKVNTQEYQAVLVPYMQYVTSAFAKAVVRLAERGIPVYFIDGAPDGICDAGKADLDAVRASSHVISLEEAAKAAETVGAAEFKIAPADNRIRYYHYEHEDGTAVYMFVNEGTDTYLGEVRFEEKRIKQLNGKVLYQYDAWENVLKDAAIEEGRLALEIEPLKSRIFIFDAAAAVEEIGSIQKMKLWESLDAQAGSMVSETEFLRSWRRSICKSIEYPGFGEAKEIRIPDNLAEEEPEFSGFVRYENSFTAKEGERFYLEITDAHEGVEVFVNGVSLGIQIVPVFRFDLSDAVNLGENQIRIEVATTLEREMAKVPNILGQIQEAKAASGITGEVKLFKVR